MTFKATIIIVRQTAARLARTITVLMFALVPAQFFVPCEGSAIITVFSLLLLGVVAGLCLLAMRFAALILALAAFILIALLTH
jgi:hypothetical protein